MRKLPFIVLLILSFILEVAVCMTSIGKFSDVQQDTVAVNACLQSIEEYYGEPDKYVKELPYVLIDNDGKVLYKTEDGLSESVNEAVKNNDTMLNVENDGEIIGKLIVANRTANRIENYKQRIVITVVCSSLVQITLIFAYWLYLRKTIIKPFERMNEFAVRVASGDLDVPLELDRKHVFGSFTEAFDLMRSELKAARLAEKKASDDKKEMVAKLSHDIKTPVASIKSSSEIGAAVTKEDKARALFELINQKSDQITTLTDNLFNASVNDITEISVAPSRYGSAVVAELIRKADYLNKAGAFEVPDCDIYIDKLRLQQAFDNVFMNSYKYADTEIKVEASIEDECLAVRIEDFGDGVDNDELPLMKLKYKRGSNSESKDGAGLGLYITDKFMDGMNGRLELRNTDKGFAVIFYVRTI